MDFTIGTTEHRAAVEAAADALPRRSGILPALALIRIDAYADGRITYQGTDLDCAIEAEVRGEVRIPGSTCLPGSQLADIARQSDREGSTRLFLDGIVARIEVGRSARFRLPACASTDYVGGPDSAFESPVIVGGDAFRSMAGRVAWAAAKEESRGLLCGVLVETTPTALRLVATNGRQLALSETPVPGLTPGLQRVVPPQFLAAAERHLKGRGPVELSLGATTVSIRVAGLTLRGRTYQGAYPKYAGVLPKQPVTTVQLPTTSLRQGVRRTGTVARGHENKAVVARFEQKGLRLWTRAPDVGTAYDEVETTALEGQTTTVAFNASMMESVLDAVSADEVRLRLHGPSGGILVDGRGEDTVRSLWMIMPVSLESVDVSEPESRAGAAPASLPAAA